MRKKILLILTAIILVILIILASVSITHVTVTGNNWYTSEQVENLVFINHLSRNSTYCFVNSMMGKKQDIPFVQDYEINFLSPVSVEIIVYEKSMVGYVSYMSSYMYFDKDGIVVESANEKLPGIPLISGLKFGQIVLNRPLPVDNQDIFAQILNLTQVLSINDIKVDKIRFDNYGKATLDIDNIEVILGDSSEMNGKISELKDMLPNIEGLAGTLYLDTYDPDNTNTMYSFKRRQQ